MEKLKLYLDSLTRPERIAFAKRCGTTIGYFGKNISSKKKLLFGTGICLRIEEESGGAVTRKDLRSDWSKHWPDLRDAA
jgi:DNA-binding transcriptional regulator YdaS (Cro superfamily)